MDNKGPSSTFKRSSLKRSASGSQKVRWNLTFNRWFCTSALSQHTWSVFICLEKKCYSLIFWCFSWNVFVAFILKVNVWCCSKKDLTTALYLQTSHFMPFILKHPETIWVLWEWLVLHSMSHATITMSWPESTSAPNQSFQSPFVWHNDMHHSGPLVVYWCGTWSALRTLQTCR